jgi:23S rRNA (uracil1939-C5)-methyltransferase
VSTNYSVGDQVDVRVERIVPRGYGIAFVEGLTVLVALAAPGDELTVRLTEVKKRLAFAEGVSVNVPSPLRQTPPCHYFGTCGGCDFQQLTYEAQLEAKIAIIRDSLHRIGKIDFEGEIPIIPSPPLEYRSRVRWQVDKETQSFGYFKRGSHDVVDIEHCPKITPELNATLSQLRVTVDPDSSDHLEIAAVSGDNGVSIASSDADQPPNEVTWHSGAETYSYSARTFFQANKFLIPPLIETAIGDANGGIAFDLYSGVGLFTLPLGRRFEKVVGVEEHSASSEMCRRNLEKAGLRNAVAIGRSVQRFLADNRTRDVDLVLLDPPRSGSEKGVIRMIAELGPREISYVSCDPSILARDLRELIDAGYRIDSLTALDLFPQTHHVETVARLSR